jgi:hypothetical protein
MDQLLSPALWLVLLAQEVEPEEELGNWTPDVQNQTPPPPPPTPARWAVGASVGLVVPRSDLNAAGQIGLNLAFRPTQHIHPALWWSWARPSATGSVSDPALDVPLPWSLSQDQNTLALGVNLRALDAEQRVHPELTLAPQWVWTRSVMTASTANAVQERTMSLGWTIAPALAVDLPDGEVTLRFAASNVPQMGVITGQASGLVLSPSLGYRRLL